MKRLGKVTELRWDIVYTATYKLNKQGELQVDYFKSLRLSKRKVDVFLTKLVDSAFVRRVRWR